MTSASVFAGETPEEREARILARAEKNKLRSEWCEHDPACEFRCYPGNGECKCGMWKHHVHGACGGVIQVG